jgi:hypothetical protein
LYDHRIELDEEIYSFKKRAFAALFLLIIFIPKTINYEKNLD